MQRTYLDSNAIEIIATGYANESDDAISIAEHDLHLMRKLINAQFGNISKNIYFDFTERDPYPYVRVKELEKDWRAGIIKVNTSGNDSMVWGKVYNLQFRAIHDYIHCLFGLDFNFQDEVRAYRKQIECSMADEYARQFPNMNWELYQAVLRSEIIYQAAVKTHFGQFHIEQKIVLTDLLNS